MNQTWTNIHCKCLNIEENESGVECVMFIPQGEITPPIIHGEVYLVLAQKLLCVLFVSCLLYSRFTQIGKPLGPKCIWLRSTFETRTFILLFACINFTHVSKLLFQFPVIYVIMDDLYMHALTGAPVAFCVVRKKRTALFISLQIPSTKVHSCSLLISGGWQWMMPWRAKNPVFSVPPVSKAFTTRQTAGKSVTFRLIQLLEILIGDPPPTQALWTQSHG